MKPAQFITALLICLTAMAQSAPWQAEDAQAGYARLVLDRICLVEAFPRVDHSGLAALALDDLNWLDEALNHRTHEELMQDREAEIRAQRSYEFLAQWWLEDSASLGNWMEDFLAATGPMRDLYEFAWLVSTQDEDRIAVLLARLARQEDENSRGLVELAENDQTTFLVFESSFCESRREDSSDE